MPAREVDHLMTSDVNKWRDALQSLHNYIFVCQTCLNSEL